MITQTTPRRSLGTIKPRHYFSDAKDFGEIQRELLQQGRKMQVGLVKIGDFWPVFRYISETVQVLGFGWQTTHDGCIWSHVT